MPLELQQAAEISKKARSIMQDVLLRQRAKDLACFSSAKSLNEDVMVVIVDFKNYPELEAVRFPAHIGVEQEWSEYKKN